MKTKKVRPGFRYLKKKRFILSVILLLFFLFFHSCMNFRTSDRKTRAYFKAAGVAATIDYMKTSVNGGKIRIVSTGAAREHTVLFVHGAPGSGDAFYSYLKDSALLAKARLVTYDRPGYGYSGFGDAMTSIEAQTRVLTEVINSQQLQNVILVGHSYGGPIAAYAPLFTDRVRGVLMLAPAMDPGHEKYFWAGNLARWKLTRWLIPASWTVSADEKYTHEAELALLKDKWKAVNVPVVCLQGNKDRLVPYENLAFCEATFDPGYFTGVTLEKEDHFIP
ncbi:MAG: alpha/beta hydrolase, partial [Sinomicrobium sp.]|nr:alpha/beta hydrolase [Sinomicrobium sp.]